MNTDCADIQTIRRTLRHTSSDEPSGWVSLSQSGILGREEPLVILGEAGMGKSTLLEWLASHAGYTLCTARGLVNRHNPRQLLGDAKVLVIDALDEFAASKDGEAVNAVLRKLGELDYPRFVLSCRAADWRSATGTEAIREQYGLQPAELYLEPLTEDDIAAYLAARLGSERATTVREHIATRGLGNMLGNPQTLNLIADVAASGDLPETRHELFTRAVALMWRDHKPSKAEKQPAESIGLDSAGAACAALILTGSETITRAATPGNDHGNLPIQEITQLPGGAMADTALDTRLFRALGGNRFGYWHRSIGEFLGAQWLARHADTPRKRRRLLSLFRSHGLVPASLRGIHAWLAHDPALAQVVTEADPLGLIEYGDTDALSLPQARHLLAALKREAQKNPNYYSWHITAAKSLFHAELTDEIRAVITSPEAAFWLRSYLIESAQGTAAIAALRDDLRRLVTDPSVPLGLRIPAINTLSNDLNDNDWREITDTLRNTSNADTLRLALHVLDVVGHHLIADDAIADLVIATTIADERMVGILFPLENHLPLDRLDGVLGELAAKASALGKSHQRRGDSSLTSFVYALLARRLASDTVTAQQIWTWLEPFEADIGHHGDDKKRVDDYLRNHDGLRREVQRLAILGQAANEDIRPQVWHLARRSAALNPSPADVVALLRTLNPANHADKRWRDLAAIWGADESVRDAARPFAANDPDQLAWLNALANPPELEWKHEEAERQRQAKELKALKRKAHHEDYLAHIDEVRTGKFGAVQGPAQAYLNLFSDLRTDLPAHQRVSQWLGEDLGEAAHAGFEAFLQATDPSAADIVKALSEGKFLTSSCIIIAAVAERLRKGAGLTDLSDERVLATFFALRGGGLVCQANLGDLEPFVETEIKRRGLLEKALRQYYEPQLQAGQAHPSGLESLMRDDTYADLAIELALDWLNRFDKLPIHLAQELVSRVIHSQQAASLHTYLDRQVATADMEHRHLLEAAGLLVAFDRTTERLALADIAPELLWEIRDLTGNGETRRGSSPVLDPPKIGWIFTTFRELWPMRYHPSGGWSGSRNPWDASEYLLALLRRLSSDHSEQARAVLQQLQAASNDGYNAAICSIAMEQTRLRAEASYVPPPLCAIDAILRDTAPTTVTDLQTLMIEELVVVQAKINSDNIESWRGFYDDNGIPYAEERCRDRLIDLLCQGGKDIHFEPEAHIAGDKEVDIVCRCGNLRLPIEVKGQWHRELWCAADTQLDRLYAADWQAERRGIYLVLWFGKQSAANKRLKGIGRGKSSPKTPTALRDALLARSSAAQEGRIAVFVLDVTRPQESHQ